VTVSTAAVGGRIVVTVSGELDLDSKEMLLQALNDALAEATTGLELDLADVGFCDSTALNVLLNVRHHARSTGKSVVLGDASPVVERLLRITGALSLFTPGQDPDGLVSENAQLHRALQTRPTIDMARGVLMASFRLDAQQAWNVLVAVSQHSNTKLHVIAEELLRTVEGGALPEPLAGHLTAAVRASRTPAAEAPGRGHRPSGNGRGPGVHRDPRGYPGAPGSTARREDPMSRDARGDDVYQPHRAESEDAADDGYDPGNALDDEESGDGAGEHSPRERPLGVEEYGTTAAEQREGEPLDERLAREVPERRPDATREP
jgi:anti-anti-sigma factor